MSTRTINAHNVVLTLKLAGRAMDARTIAELLGGTDSRAVATAARKPVADGRIKIRYPRGLNRALYRFVRMTAKAGAK